MILIATQVVETAQQWRQALLPFYAFYPVDVHDLRALSICLKKVPIEVLLLDLALLGKSGIHEISTVLSWQKNLHIIVFARHPDEREEVGAILFGAKAYCPYDVGLALLPNIVSTVLRNEIFAQGKIFNRLLQEIQEITQNKHRQAQALDQGIALLTERERQIAEHIAKGASNRQIAQSLNITERTVKSHLGMIFKKLNLHDRLQLAIYLYHHQLIPGIWHQKD